MDEPRPERGIWLPDGAFPLPPCLGDKLIDWEALVHAGGQPIDKDVLDVGPCFGIDAAMFAPSCRYVALDIDRNILDHVGRFAPPAELCFGSMLALPFPENRFDLVLDFGSFDNCAEPFRAYREAARVLRTGGRLVSTYANLAALGAATSPDGTEIRSHPRDLEAHLAAHGLTTLWAERTRARATVIAEKTR